MSKIKLVKFPLKVDQRGKLTFFETGKNILIPIKRVFSVSIPLKKKGVIMLIKSVRKL